MKNLFYAFFLVVAMIGLMATTSSVVNEPAKVKFVIIKDYEQNDYAKSFITQKYKEGFILKSITAPYYNSGAMICYKGLIIMEKY